MTCRFDAFGKQKREPIFSSGHHKTAINGYIANPHIRHNRFVLLIKHWIRRVFPAANTRM